MLGQISEFSRVCMCSFITFRFIFVYHVCLHFREHELLFFCRATYQATDWFFNHLAGIMPVVMVTDDKKVQCTFILA